MDSQYQVSIDSLASRIDMEVKHINTLVEQQLGTLRALLTQRIDFFEADSKKDLDLLAARITDIFQEVRGYKDVLNQQMVLLDSSLKRTNEELQNLKTKEEITEEFKDSLRQSILDLEKKIDTFCDEYTDDLNILKKDLETIQLQHRDEKTAKTTLEEQEEKQGKKVFANFFSEYGKESLVGLLTFLGTVCVKILQNLIDKGGK